jgi:hypothetical protein
MGQMSCLMITKRRLTAQAIPRHLFMSTTGQYLFTS